MTTAASPPGGHSTPLGLMSCVRESSPQDLVPQTDLMDIERHETSKKRRFHPFRGLRKMFRRGASSGGGKVRTAGSEETVPVEGPPLEDNTSANDAHRSRSTSELLAAEEPRRKSGGVTGGMYTGGGNLSVSHDSVFTAEQHSTRGDSTSSDLDTAQSSSSLSIKKIMHQTGVRAELLDAVRRRGRSRGDTSEDEEDLGLPRSPCNSPTTTDKALKEHPTKSHSTCSDGSLLSMGSSEMDEDSFGQHSRHSSKLSLHDRRPSQPTDCELELGLTSTTAPLSHSAARHKMAVRPKRTHGAPRRRRVQQLTVTSALPTTPEVNEEISTRSLTPEGTTTRESVAELYSNSSRTSMTGAWNMTSSVTVPDTQLKSASLPPGLALPSGSNKLSRSRSNAGKAFAEEEEDSSKEDKKKEESFFGRFLARRSGKKKKYKSEDSDIGALHNVHVIPGRAMTFDHSENSTTHISSSSTYKYTEDKRTYSIDSGISKVARSGPAARQRVLPIDIPASPEARQKRHPHIELDLPLPPSVASEQASPPKKMHMFLPKQSSKVSPTTELPTHTSESQTVPIPSPRTILPKPNSSPPNNSVVPAPRSIAKSPPKLASWIEKPSSLTQISENKLPNKEECKTKVKITGLSSYQQRVMSYNEEFDGFKSLEETEQHEIVTTKSSIITKSQSFRTNTVLTSSQDHSSLPFSVNSSIYDHTNSDSEAFTDSLVSTNTLSSDLTDNTVVIPKNKETESIKDKPTGNGVKIINIESKAVNKQKEENTSSSTVFISNENKSDGITISCVNSQMQASVNTKSTNQVVVSISNTSESVHHHELESTEPPQVSVTKVQLKRDSKTSLPEVVAATSPTQTAVPEFLKIQLNKVDNKPSKNVVLTTSNSFAKADEVSKPKASSPVVEPEKEIVVESMIDFKRKFSKDDVEIVDKETVEEKNVQLKVSDKNLLKSPVPVVNNNVQIRKTSLVSPTVPISPKPFLKKKSNSLDLDSIKLGELSMNKVLASSTDQLCNKTSSSDTSLSQESSPEVVLRNKKSLVSQKHKDSDEPELMKVFARRSLKLKDSDVETLSQQVMVLVEADNKKEESENKRDSDKENEGNESPGEERKKPTFPVAKEAPKPKEPLSESKIVDADVTLRKPSCAINNKLSVFGGSKYQRAVTLTTSVVPNNDANSNVNDNANEEKKRNKSFIEAKTEKKQVIPNYRSPHIMNMKEKDSLEIKKPEITKKNAEEFNVSLKKDFENEDYVPRFKRIQQRKEEWEQRAQQNMKKTVP